MFDSKLTTYNDLITDLMISEGGRGFYYPTDEMKNLANECNKLYKSSIKIDDNV